MKVKRLSLLMIAALLVTVFLAACGSGQDATADEAAHKDAASIAETTVVLETTADGGTIEQDSEGNKITKDSKGEVIRVEDKNGNELDVTEYLTTHSGAGASDAGDQSGGSSGASRQGGGSSASSQAGGSGTSGETVSSGSQTEGVEEDLPVVIATIPDDDDELITLD